MNLGQRGANRAANVPVSLAAVPDRRRPAVVAATSPDLVRRQWAVDAEVLLPAPQPTRAPPSRSLVVPLPALQSVHRAAQLQHLHPQAVPEVPELAQRSQPQRQAAPERPALAPRRQHHPLDAREWAEAREVEWEVERLVVARREHRSHRRLEAVLEGQELARLRQPQPLDAQEWEEAREVEWEVERLAVAQWRLAHVQEWEEAREVERLVAVAQWRPAHVQEWGVERLVAAAQWRPAHVRAAWHQQLPADALAVLVVLVAARWPVLHQP